MLTYAGEQFFRQYIHICYGTAIFAKHEGYLQLSAPVNFSYLLCKDLSFNTIVINISRKKNIPPCDKKTNPFKFIVPTLSN